MFPTTVTDLSDEDKKNEEGSATDPIDEDQKDQEDSTSENNATAIGVGVGASAVVGGTTLILIVTCSEFTVLMIIVIIMVLVIKCLKANKKNKIADAPDQL